MLAPAAIHFPNGLRQAFEIAGTLDSADIRAAVVGHEFKGTVMGDVKYGKDGVATFPEAAFQWHNGYHELCFPAVEGGWNTPLLPWNVR